MTPEEFRQITYEATDGVAVVTLNRPERGNAWSGPMSVEYRWALHHAETDPDVRVVVLTGAGRAFCVGADTAALDAIEQRGGRYEKEQTPLPPFPEGTPPDLHHNHTAPLGLGVPVIAAINGACAGAGFVLATYADLRWSAASARFASAFAGLGLPAEYGMGWMLPRITGAANALQLLWDPSPRQASAVAELGFVQKIVPDGELMAAVTTYAATLARHSSPQSMRTMKRSVWIDASASLDVAYRRSVEDMELAMRSPDFKTGLAATRAKLRPDFA